MWYGECAESGGLRAEYDNLREYGIVFGNLKNEVARDEKICERIYFYYPNMEVLELEEANAVNEHLLRS